jgi:transposase, IS5 family
MHYKTVENQGGLFDYQQRCRELARRGTGLDRLNAAVDWAAFRPVLEARLAYGDGAAGGRPAWDPVLMFKVLVLQKYHGLSDEQTEFQILDRFSFQRFLGLGVGDKVPDEKTVWVFKERLGADGVRELFERFLGELAQQNLIGQQGKIVDASFVDAPRPRNTPQDNAAIKAGERPAHFDENPASGRQKDTDARWAQKGAETHFGYKNHTKADVLTKCITAYAVTPASTHDSQALPALVERGDRVLYADSAYHGAPGAKILSHHGITNYIHEKGARGRPLSPAQQKLNRLKSRLRCRVEHVFARLAHWRADRFRRRTLRRAEFEIGLANLVYNLDRFAYLQSAG